MKATSLKAPGKDNPAPNASLRAKIAASAVLAAGLALLPACAAPKQLQPAVVARPSPTKWVDVNTKLLVTRNTVRMVAVIGCVVPFIATSSGLRGPKVINVDEKGIDFEGDLRINFGRETLIGDGPLFQVTIKAEKYTEGSALVEITYPREFSGIPETRNRAPQASERNKVEFPISIDMLCSRQNYRCAIETRLVREGDILIGIEMPNKAGNLAFKVVKVDDWGVEFALGTESPGIEPASNLFRVEYGKEKQIGEFAVSVTFKAEKGTEPGNAKVTIIGATPIN